MNKQKFFKELKKHGLNESNIEGLYNTYLKIKEDDKDMALDEWFNKTVQANEEIKDEPTNVLTF